MSIAALIGEEASDRPNGNYPAAFSLWTGQVVGMAGEPDGARPYGAFSRVGCIKTCATKH